MKKEESLLKVEGLKKYFEVKSGLFDKEIKCVKAVDGISFDLKKGETLAIVGESGCGKSTAGRTILRLIEKTEGKVEFNGVDIYKLETWCSISTASTSLYDFLAFSSIMYS